MIQRKQPKIISIDIFADLKTSDDINYLTHEYESYVRQLDVLRPHSGERCVLEAGRDIARARINELLS